MSPTDGTERNNAAQDARWYPVYLLALVFTVAVITAALSVILSIVLGWSVNLTTSISFLWFNVVGCLVVVSVRYLPSLAVHDEPNLTNADSRL